MLREVNDTREAVKRLWKVLPVGAGKDFNTVLKYIESLEREVNLHS